MGRLEDENRAPGEVNRLYLKVVETLAMAVDAKDQVTHGHIRRVQTYALRLAKTLGVTDPQRAEGHRSRRPAARHRQAGQSRSTSSTSPAS